MTIPKRFLMALSQLVGTTSLFAATGCATIVGKSEYPVVFDTEPSGARIVVTDRDGHLMYKGESPVTLTLSSSAGYFRAASYDVKASKDGFEPGTGLLTANVDPYYFCNIFFGGLIGMLIVDPATGAMYRLPAWIKLQLSTKNMSRTEDTDPWRRHVLHRVGAPESLQAGLLRSP